MSDVLACIDGSPASQAVCDYAAWASRRLDAALTLLHVLSLVVSLDSQLRVLTHTLIHGHKLLLLPL